MNEFFDILTETIRTATFQPARAHAERWPEPDRQPRTRIHRETRRPR